MADCNNNGSRIYEVGESSSSSGRRYPPGYKFTPTDEEVVLYYLQPKIKGSALPDDHIHEADVYEQSPADLDEKYEPHDNKEWYFLTASRKRKYTNGNGPDRKAGDGFWKATGGDKEIMHENEVIGFRKSLNYRIGDHKSSIKSDWIMHEYRVNHPSVDDKKKDKLDEYILCRLCINEKGYGKKSSSNATDDPKTNGRNDETPNDGEDKKGKGKRSKSKNRSSKVMDDPVINDGEDETPRKRSSPYVMNDPVMSDDNLTPNVDNNEQPCVQSYNYLNNRNHQMISSNYNNPVPVNNYYNHPIHYPISTQDVAWNADNNVNNVGYSSSPTYCYPNGVAETPIHCNLGMQGHSQTYAPLISSNEYNGCQNYVDDTNVLMAGRDDSYTMAQPYYRVSSLPLPLPSPTVKQMTEQQTTPPTVNQIAPLPVNQTLEQSTAHQMINQQAPQPTVNQMMEQRTTPPASYPTTHSNQANQAQTNLTKNGNWLHIRRSSSGLRALIMSQLTAYQSRAQ